eukprot:COSAG02_NODE_5929_length_3935_cov_4.714286_5_plen_146_part_00
MEAVFEMVLSLLLQEESSAPYFFGYMGAAFALIFASAFHAPRTASCRPRAPPCLRPFAGGMPLHQTQTYHTKESNPVGRYSEGAKEGVLWGMERGRGRGKGKKGAGGGGGGGSRSETGRECALLSLSPRGDPATGPNRWRGPAAR